MYLQELDERLSKIVIALGFLDPVQGKKCIELSRSTQGHSSLAQLLLRQGYLPSETLFRLVAMIQNSEIICLKCSTRYLGSDFANPNQFLCASCGEPIQVEKQIVLPRADLSVQSDTWQDNLLGKDEPLKFEPEVFIGKTLAGTEIREFIGKGSMGLVFLGYQQSHNRMVALKLISPTVARSKEFINRFQREALTTLQLKHPNIIQVYGGGDDGGQKYILMEYVQGQTLQDLIESRGSLSEQEGIYILYQIAQGLQEAHNRYIIHRDIKPENIFVDSSLNAKLADFGIAKDFTQASVTQAGAVLGTPHYMSPEQVEGKDLDARADVYSLGATLYCALVGHPPHEGDNPINVMYKQVNEPLVFPKEKRDSLSSATKKLVSWMMTKEKHRRPSSIREVIEQMATIYKALKEKKEPTISIPVGSSDRIPNKKSPSRSSAKGTSFVLPAKQGAPLWLKATVAFVILLIIGAVVGMGMFYDKLIGPPPKKKPQKPLVSTGPKKTPPPKTKPTPDTTESAPVELFHTLLEMLKKKDYKEALALLDKNIIQYPNDKSLPKKREGILAERKQFSKKKREMEENLQTAETLLKRYPSNLKRIQWAISQCEEGVNFFSYDSLKAEELRKKSKALLLLGIDLSLKKNYQNFFFWFAEKLNTYGYKFNDWLTKFMEHWKSTFEKDRNLRKKAFQDSLDQSVKDTEIWLKKPDSIEKKAQLQQLRRDQVSVTRSYYENLLQLYKEYLNQYQSLSLHPKISLDEERKKIIFDYRRAEKEGFHDLSREWKQIKGNLK